MLNVWLNHWFSTAYNIIELLKQDYADVHIIGSNEHEYSAIKNVCDEWYVEPVLKDKEYVDFCLEFCRSHDVKVFIPRREMLQISKNKVLFERIGVDIMVDDYDIVKTLNHKEEAYSLFKERGIGIVPDYYIVTRVQEFENAYEELKKKYEQVCFKFVRDEGGKSFRLIDNRRKGYAALFKKQNTRMTMDDVLSALSEREEFSQIMVMPFLSGDEVSVDCLNTGRGLIALPRIKGYDKFETLRYDDGIIDICRKFQEISDLKHPYNIQFKYMNGVPYILEVNTRMSGGIHMSCYASGVNIPQIALRKIVGEEADWHISKETMIVSQIMKPVVIS